MSHSRSPILFFVSLLSSLPMQLSFLSVLRFPYRACQAKQCLKDIQKCAGEHIVHILFVPSREQTVVRRLLWWPQE